MFGYSRRSFRRRVAVAFDAEFYTSLAFWFCFVAFDSSVSVFTKVRRAASAEEDLLACTYNSPS